MPNISGTVFDASGNPAAGRIVRAYRRDTGALLAETLTSDGISSADPHWDNVSLLLHMDGAVGSTVFIDSSLSPKTVTPNGNVQIRSAQSVFGGGSGYFDGSGDYLSLTASADFGFELADFTIEAFIYITGGQGTDRGITDFRATNGGDVGTFFIDGPAGNRLAFWHGEKIGATGRALDLNTWYHVALSRENGVFRCFIDGVKDWEQARAVNFGTSRPLGIGGSVASGLSAGSSPFMGYIDELRITKGVARYTENFTPPNKPFPARKVAPPLGKYEINTTYTGECNVICLDDNEGTTYNDLILRTIPV